MPKISVIIPVYNVEKYLRECLDSVVGQTFRDLEIILLDDGGKDKCPEIIDEYALKDRRIISIHKQNGGYGQTCNMGLERATGEYVAIVEPDDYIDHKMYEDLYKIAEEFDSDIVKSGFYNNYQTRWMTKIIKDEWSAEIPDDRSFTIKEYPYFMSYHPSIWSCIYKREFLNKNNIRFVEAPGAGWADNPFQVQTMCLAQKINYTSNAYYYWRKLNYFDSDDLKDYTIPFKRSDEIHNWLLEHNIDDKGILLNLYLRELIYIEIILGIKKISDEKDYFARIKAMTDRMDKELIFQSKGITKKSKVKINNIFNHPLSMRRKIRFKRFKQNLISIRWNKKEKRVMLFGKVLSGGAKCKINH